MHTNVSKVNTINQYNRRLFFFFMSFLIEAYRQRPNYEVKCPLQLAEWTHVMQTPISCLFTVFPVNVKLSGLSSIHINFHKYKNESMVKTNASIKQIHVNGELLGARNDSTSLGIHSAFFIWYFPSEKAKSCGMVPPSRFMSLPWRSHSQLVKVCPVLPLTEHITNSAYVYTFPLCDQAVVLLWRLLLHAQQLKLKQP